MRLDTIDLAETIRTGGIAGLITVLTAINEYEIGLDNLRPAGIENAQVVPGNPSDLIYLQWMPIVYSANAVTETLNRTRDRLPIPQLRGITALLCDKMAAIPMTGSNVVGNPSLQLAHAAAATGVTTVLATISGAGWNIDQERTATFASTVIRPGDALVLRTDTSAGANLFNRLAVRVRLRCAPLE